jgi:hypothetical protein
LYESYLAVKKAVSDADAQFSVFEEGRNALIRTAICKLVIFARDVAANPAAQRQLPGFKDVKVCGAADDYNKAIKCALG